MNSISKRHVIFLDIDGTLMGNSPKALKRNLDVIQKVRSLGHKVLVNTGRSTAYMPQNIDLEKSFDGVISGAGARIVLDKKEIHLRPVEKDAIRRYCEFCFGLSNVCIIEGVEEMYFVGLETEEDYEWPSITRENIEEYLSDELLAEKFTILGEVPKELSKVMGEKFSVLQHGDYAEIIQKNFTKAGAMKYVMDVLGLPCEQSIAMGDSLNDYDMIECAGIGVAMGNAIPEIKEIATFVTDDADDAGVAVALEKIFDL